MDPQIEGNPSAPTNLAQLIQQTPFMGQPLVSAPDASSGVVNPEPSQVPSPTESQEGGDVIEAQITQGQDEAAARERDRIARLEAENLEYRTAADTAAQEAQTLKAQIEERNFEAFLRKNLDDGTITEAQAVAARFSRREKILAAENEQLKQERATRAQTEEASRQRMAKTVVASAVANQYGLPPAAIEYLRADDVTDKPSMLRKAEMLRSLMVQGGTQQVQQPVQQSQQTQFQSTINPDAFVSGGDNGAPAMEQVEERSGNLSGYIKSVPWQGVRLG